MKFRVIAQWVAGWLALGASAAFGHGFDLSVNSFSNPTSVTAISQSPFFDLYEETAAPQNLFLGSFGASLQSNSGGLFYSIIHGAAETSGAFPDYTATVNVVSPLYFADGSSKFASLAQAGTQLVLTDRFVGQYPGATAGSITVTGQSGVYPTGIGVSLFDAHELLKQLYIGSGPTDGEYGFAYDITIHFASGQTMTTGPLVNVFAISDPDAGDFADFATPAQQHAATRAIYGAAMADVNFDAKVDIQDLTMIANHWLQTGVIGQLSGDANRDGRVDIQDVTSVANFWNPGTAGGGGAIVVVPEPTGLALGGFGLVLCVVSFLRRRVFSANCASAPAASLACKKRTSKTFATDARRCFPPVAPPRRLHRDAPSAVKANALTTTSGPCQSPVRGPILRGVLPLLPKWQNVLLPETSTPHFSAEISMTTSSSSVRRFGVVLLSAGFAIAALVVVATPTGCKPKTTSTPAPTPPPVRVPKPISVDFVPKEALFALAIDPERTFTTPKLRMSELAQFKTLLNADTGLDMSQIEQVLVVGGLGSGLSPFYGAIMRYKEAMPRQQILQTISPAWDDVSAGDKKYQKPKEGTGPCIYFADDKTLVVAPETTLKQMLNVPADADSLVLQRLKKMDDSSTVLAVVDIKRLNGLLALMSASTGGKLPAPFDKPPLANFRDLLKLVNDAVVKIEVEPELEISATLYSPDEEKAVAANTLIGDTLKAVGEMLDEQSESADAGTESQLAEVMKGQYNGIVRELTRTQKGNEVSIKLEGKVLAFNVNSIVPLAVAPYIKSWSNAHNAQSVANLGRIASALDAYVAAKKTYPAPASLDASGKPLLSWRVHLLPMLGEQALYEEFHLDEPWDSEHNKALVGRIPAVYRHPQQPATGKTQLLLPTGPGTLFAGVEGPKPESITDDKSKTIVLFEVEASKGVEWTKPADLVLDPNDPVKGLRGYITLPLNVVFADGSVGTFDFEKQSLDLRSLLSPAGGDSDAPPAAPEKPAAEVKRDAEAKLSS